MPYITYKDDPLAKRVSAAYADLCSKFPHKKFLKLVDRCFSIFNGSKKEATFCELEEFIYPVDGQLSINFEVCANETLSIFDNGLDDISSYTASGTPANYPLGADSEYIDSVGNGTVFYLTANDRNYARGCILYVTYPSLDKNGDDVLPADNECKLILTNRTLETYTVSLHQFFAHFSNPETRGADSLINKIEIFNPNDNFSIKVTGLIVYVKSNEDPSDCAC